MDVKSDGSWVTDADLFIEERIRDLVAVEFPSVGFFGEETGEVVGESARTWIVDPIDGTQQYLRGQDFWGILLAGVVSGTPEFGIVCHPARGELIWAKQGAGCFARRGGSDTRLRVSAVTRLEAAYVLHNGIASAERTGFAAGLRSVALAANAERGYADSFGHTEVIRGRADVMIDCLAEPQDIAAVAVCAREAGGLRISLWCRSGVHPQQGYWPRPGRTRRGIAPYAPTRHCACANAVTRTCLFPR